MDNKKVGKFICELRKEKGWTQDELAEKLFVDRTMVSKWERGVYIPTTEILLKMQELFDVSINEIIFGERKNINNLNSVDAVPIQIMKEEKKKRKKLLIFSSIIIFILILSFFVYYFINNYNSIKVYIISGENSDFSVSDGILVISKEKSYISIGNIKNDSNKEITNIRIFYLKNGAEKDIFNGNNLDTRLLLVNYFGYDGLFKYDDISYILKTMKMEIDLNNDEKSVIDLILKKDYANNRIVEELQLPISDEKTNENINNLPEYITKNFSYDRENDLYERKEDNTTEEFFVNINTYVITIKHSNYEEKIFYDLSGASLECNVFYDSGDIITYIYNIKSDSCEYGDCKYDFIENIKANYIKKLIN